MTAQLTMHHTRQMMTPWTTSSPPRTLATVNAEHVRAAWDQAGWIEVDDPNGPEYGTVRLPLNEASRVERFLAILGVEVHP